MKRCLYKISFFLLALFLSSCVRNYDSSYLTSCIPAVNRESITEFIIGELKTEYRVPPEQRLFFSPSGNRAFDKSLENAARTAGFQVESVQTTKAVVVRYVIDVIKETGTSYIQLSTSDGLTLSRTFDTKSVVMNSRYLQSGRSQDE